MKCILNGDYFTLQCKTMSPLCNSQSQIPNGLRMNQIHDLGVSKHHCNDQRAIFQVNECHILIFSLLEILEFGLKIAQLENLA